MSFAPRHLIFPLIDAFSSPALSFSSFMWMLSYGLCLSSTNYYNYIFPPPPTLMNPFRAPSLPHGFFPQVAAVLYVLQDFYMSHFFIPVLGFFPVQFFSVFQAFYFAPGKVIPSISLPSKRLRSPVLPKTLPLYP